MAFAEHVKSSLLSLIKEMASTPWLFSKNPDADFSRSRKLDFASTIQFILSMESGCLKKELLDYFRFSTETPSASAFREYLAAFFDIPGNLFWIRLRCPSNSFFAVRPSKPPLLL